MEELHPEHPSQIFCNTAACLDWSPKRNRKRDVTPIVFSRESLQHSRFETHGLPERVRVDRDPRWVGASAGQRFSLSPAAVLCLSERRASRCVIRITPNKIVLSN